MNYPMSLWLLKQKGKDKGKRFPVTYSGLRGAIQTAFRHAGITDFKIHDLRHDFASKLLRRTNNLALVKDALAHSDIKSTLRYAHVLGDDIARGMEGMTTGMVPERQSVATNGKKEANWNNWEIWILEADFELCSRSRCATGLRCTPTFVPSL